MGNQLYQVPSHAFHSFDKLEILELSQNMFSVIEEEAFLGLDKLRTLQINGCSQLEQIAAGAFSNLGDLEEMELASNRKLRLIHPQSFGSGDLASAPKIGEDNVGNKMLQKMGWKDGLGLGKKNQGRTDVIDVQQRTAMSGLGTAQSAGNPNESYKENARKTLWSRYNNA